MAVTKKEALEDEILEQEAVSTEAGEETVEEPVAEPIEAEEEEPEEELAEEPEEEPAEEPENAPEEPERRRTRRTRNASRPSFNPASVITLERGIAAVTNDRQTEESVYWHELRNSQLTRKILHGTMSSFERMRLDAERSINVAVVEYHGFRVVIPVAEMNIDLGDDKDNFVRQNKIASNMVGCDLDFIVTDTDEKSHAVVASRRLAMRRKVNDFYLPPAEGVSPVIHVDSVVEARVVAVSEVAIRIEVFGAECFVRSLEMDYAWIPDARDKYHVGDVVRVRISKVVINNDGVTIAAEGRSLCNPDTAVCAKNGKYLGVVTGFSKGMYFLRLQIGLNAIVHSYDGVTQLPQKRDQVAFVCTRMDEENHVAIGIITKLIRRGNK